jgi:hypothetical protein
MSDFDDDDLNTIDLTPEQEAAAAAAIAAAARELGSLSLIEFDGGKKIWREVFGDKTEIGATEPFIANVFSYTLSLKKFWKSNLGKNEMIARIGPGRRVDGFTLRTRAEWPDRDQTKWQLKGAKRKDPWMPEYGIELKRESGEIYLWRISFDGEETLSRLFGFFARGQHPGKMPEVLLGFREKTFDSGSMKVWPVLQPTGRWLRYGAGSSPPPNPANAPKFEPVAVKTGGNGAQSAPPIGEEDPEVPPAPTPAQKGADPDDEIPF